MTQYKPNYETVFEDAVHVFDTIFHHPKENLERETSFIVDEFETIRQDREPENLKRSLESLKAAQEELKSLRVDADTKLEEHRKNVKEISENLYTLKSAVDVAEANYRILDGAKVSESNKKKHYCLSLSKSDNNWTWI
ncbi:hypothetical protein K493DRAFT_349867 [Basidiobolus meristosporus CBS 931.73]|uniref:Biogenesis of lysosome-related organelles complex 1 subunit 5 n=1 Tax=Basidiobolus meristosporus CBS 931.73 TaxID=1314790 RepID=A0A1Y1YI70_9FUNG|nr:hypothetical protein K493DRAFT_349867 [Basidiobolus meristosporus CBS 931.73]|eukprot:ORX97730.1 hypothetical protein K493DRAFT_349867 [Basidiobolus meristosporus CBS 931.73]